MKAQVLYCPACKWVNLRWNDPHTSDLNKCKGKPIDLVKAYEAAKRVSFEAGRPKGFGHLAEAIVNLRAALEAEG